MAHNARTHSDAVWTNGGSGGYVTLESDWESLDKKLFQALNGDKGGCWAPSSAVVFGDVGNSASPSLNVTGPTLVGYGGSIKTAAGSRFTFDPMVGYPKIGTGHVGATRRIVTACIHRAANPPYAWTTLPTSGSIQSIAMTIADTSPVFAAGFGFGFGDPSLTRTTLIQPAFRLPLRVHDGARLTRATLTFRVPNARTAAPLAMPRMRIVAVDASGNVFPLKNTIDGSGYDSPAQVTSGTAWFANGTAQSFVYTCDQNNSIDTSLYHYEAQVIEEVGAVSPPGRGQADGLLVVEKKINVDAASTNPVTLSGVQSVDGLTTFDGARVLVKDQADPSLNRIYTASSGSWTAAVDTSLAEDFTPLFLVAVGGGGIGGAAQTGQLGQVWQLALNTTTNVQFQRRVPHGNIYHSIACDFDRITDLRFQ